ncbi:MAG: hypothetical protein ACK4RK_09355 [Gemmataceae bacterium]
MYCNVAKVLGPIIAAGWTAFSMGLHDCLAEMTASYTAPFLDHPKRPPRA